MTVSTYTREIGGITYHLRVEQFDTSAYIAVRGGDVDADGPVDTSDAITAIRDAAAGVRDYDPETCALLHMAADVLGGRP